MFYILGFNYHLRLTSKRLSLARRFRAMCAALSEVFVTPSVVRCARFGEWRR